MFVVRAAVQREMERLGKELMGVLPNSSRMRAESEPGWEIPSAG